MTLMEPCKMCCAFRNDTGHENTGVFDPAMCSKFALTVIEKDCLQPNGDHN